MMPGSGQSIIDRIFSHEVFKGLDRAALVARYDQTPALSRMKAPIRGQSRQSQPADGVITSIPPQGIVISQPGTYTFGQDVTWTPPAAACTAITITCGNVTLDLAGYSLSAVVQDNSQQIVGILVQNAATVTIRNGTLANMCFYGICAETVDSLSIQNINVNGMSFANLSIRNACPAGIHVDGGSNVTLSGCVVQGMDVTSDSSAGIQILKMQAGQVAGCQVIGLTNRDGSAQGYSYILSEGIITSKCSADTLTTQFGGNIETLGHTSIGFVPIFCAGLRFNSCSASNITGCCDDAHGMSVFLDLMVGVDGFTASNVVDGPAPYNTGAKATGLEVYGVLIQITNCSVSNIRAIVPQDRQSAGFSAWGATIEFLSCSATDVVVTDANGKPDTSFGYGVGYGWAPDPRSYFCSVGAYDVEYDQCTATTCQVGFDSWFHVNSTWEAVSYPGCDIGILQEPGGSRTISANACSECNPPITVTLQNIASGNTFPPS